MEHSPKGASVDHIVDDYLATVAGHNHQIRVISAHTYIADIFSEVVQLARQMDLAFLHSP